MYKIESTFKFYNLVILFLKFEYTKKASGETLTFHATQKII